MTDEELERLEEEARAALRLEGTALDLAKGVFALLERVRKVEAQVAELVREGHKASLNRDDAVDMLGRVRAERDELRKRVEFLEDNPF